MSAVTPLEYSYFMKLNQLKQQSYAAKENWATAVNSNRPEAEVKRLQGIYNALALRISHAHSNGLADESEVIEDFIPAKGQALKAPVKQQAIAPAKAPAPAPKRQTLGQLKQQAGVAKQAIAVATDAGKPASDIAALKATSQAIDLRVDQAIAKGLDNDDVV